ncbi:SDR family oxidoreductase [Pseudocitrobacter faecalis]|uniref:SDR family oxidoreductase n=1 Tax=Pseudocitrobacter faecalis TaxID=1398493 RepID=UPI001676F6B4|nr:SDR family oxidoreductase [Pseudocitrobacter faecalis]GHD94122.1 3-oxoacyl-ACP reductase [Pseudocitrobacter faecalis]
MTQKWMLITGGSRGIGQALVTHLQSRWNIVFTGRNEDSINHTMLKAQALNTSTWVRGFCCDGSDEAEVSTLAARLLADFGAPSAIVHNAGMTKDALHIHQTANEWREIMDNNLISIVNWNHQLLPVMMTEGHGSLVLMSSVSAVMGNSGQTAYAASKAAMMGLARSLAREVGRFGIRVNCLAPGLIESDMIQAIPEQKLKALRQNIPLRRLGHPQEVAQAVAFLTGEESRYMTGQTLILDGGLSA